MRLVATWCRRGRHNRGSVTAETAVVLPVLVVAIVVGLWIGSVTVAALRCGDAARDGARAAARGEALTMVRAAAQRQAPSGSTVEVSTAGGLVRVRVATRVQPWRRIGRFVPAVPVSSVVTAAQEGR